MLPNKTVTMRIGSLLAITLTLVALASALKRQGEDPHGTDSSDSLMANVNDTAIFDALIGDESLEETIRNVLLQLRNRSDLNIPGVEIPDPMGVPAFDNRVQQGYIKADVKLWNVTIRGLSSFLLDEVSANLEDMNISIGMNLTNLKIEGSYKLNGTYTIVRLSGAGGFWMKMIGAYVPGNIQLRVDDDGLLQVANIKMDCNVSDIQLHFEKLFGGGAMSTFSNTLLNALSKLMFENVKPAILDELETTVKTVLDEQFRTLPRQPMLSRAKSPLDLAIANTATQIRERGLDPFKAPDFQQSFNRRFLVFRVSGNVTLYGGYIRGLSSIHRTGPIRMTFKDNSLTAVADLGFDALEGGYKFDATLMKVARKGGVHFQVKGLSLMFTATQINEQHQHPQIQELKITRLEKMALDVDGLGSFDYLLEFFTNFFTNAFKKQFARITETQLKKVLQENLNKVQMPF